MRHWARMAAVCLFVGGIVAWPAPAAAIGPPIIAPGPPPTGPVAPMDPTEQKTVCAQATTLPGTQFQRRPAGDMMLDYSAAWRFSRGAGQKVAVIDTGVSPNPRLLALEPGGDYVSSSDGLADCDAHGTLVAGIIAAAPSPDDGFSGVAPEAAILSIRQNSGVYSVKGTGPAQDDPNATSAGYGNTRTLAYAIVRAVDLGATVINLSEAACAPVGTDIDDAAVGQAVRYAFERNVVVVAAAGNIASQGMCSAQNGMGDPNLPVADAWASVRTVASPAWFSEYVLTVGAVTTAGRPADFSLRGPWVDVAAPGEQITSLSSTGPGLMNAWLDPTAGPVPVNGTSFAAPYVSGVVALVRSRFPEMSAGEVMERIKRTARTAASGADDTVGYGVVDPLAAITFEVPAQSSAPDAVAAVAAPAPVGSANHRARDLGLVVLLGCAVLAGIAITVLNMPMRK
ncbi:type VII secretion-associated serine protease mycosin [Mycolicibacterium baixiangningiae]|uniref:type VII secretion-associated serine protease mycosin n=1 Tax=Mycolicibacterium baixiangningiae TaxID=2761578 RepID=UPI0027DA7F51|nr:type VII secretion-associated serine protease mycosin [Mycolicibacterium baixiangningiae]